MLPRERVFAALDYRPVDMPPLRVHPSPGGLYEHGAKLLDLLRATPHDFGDGSELALPAPIAPDERDADGRYHAVRTDAWGTTWEHRIPGIWGHPLVRPLDDWAALETWRPPAPPPAEGPGLEGARRRTAELAERWFVLGGGGALFERMYALRRFEDVLADLGSGAPELERLADRLTEHCAGCLAHALAAGVDGVMFADDFGTQESLLFSPACFRRVFKPRLEALFAPVRRAGKRIFFHSCGQIGALLDDLADLGVDAIWPQLPAFDLPELARRCRSLGLAVELHPDRGELMQRAQPGEVRDYVLRLVDTFDVGGGGSWLYLEVDPGFAWPNVEMLFRTVQELRA